MSNESTHDGMMEKSRRQKFDLEDRTRKYTKDVRLFIKLVPKKFENVEDLKQLLRSSGSVAANYIEANEALSKKDFLNRIKICRKEAKESAFWLNTLMMEAPELEDERHRLQQESHEFELIFGAILRNSQ